MAADVLCGPGNNGGDGYVVAKLLKEAGMPVRLWALGQPKQGTDAATAAAECPIEAKPLTDFSPPAGSIVPASVIIDALFGAGLSKTIEGDAAKAIEKCNAASVPVVAVDLPSGVSGDSGNILGAAFKADTTVTFFRKKPGHLLQPGREFCGETTVAQIGIGPPVLDTIRPACFENTPALWGGVFPRPATNTHKYARGHVGVFSGGPSSTGAARLSARAAARAGAGAVTLLSPGSALQVNAAHLTSIILRKADLPEEVAEWLADRKPGAVVFGPGIGLQESVGDFALKLIAASAGIVRHIVFDADALTHLSRRRDEFLSAFRAQGAPQFVLTPHEGEFTRVFPEFVADKNLSKVERARKAALLAKATIILKGPDTVIASLRRPRRDQCQCRALACHGRLGRRACRYHGRPAVAGHALLRSCLRRGLAACRSRLALRAGPDRRRPAGPASACVVAICLPYLRRGSGPDGSVAGRDLVLASVG